MADYGRVAIYNYFAELRPHDEKDADYITMYLFDGGWVWLIPLRGWADERGDCVSRSAGG